MTAIREAVERLEAQLAERMKYAPKPMPHRFSVPPNERTMTVKVEDLRALLSAYEELGKVLEEIANWNSTYEHSDYGAGYDTAVDEISERARKHIKGE